MEAGAVGQVIRLNWVIIIIASRAQEGAPVDTECGNGIIKDSEDGIILVA